MTCSPSGLATLTGVGPVSLGFQDAGLQCSNTLTLASQGFSSSQCETFGAPYTHGTSALCFYCESVHADCSRLPIDRQHKRLCACGPSSPPSPPSPPSPAFPPFVAPTTAPSCSEVTKTTYVYAIPTFPRTSEESCPPCLPGACQKSVENVGPTGTCSDEIANSNIAFARRLSVDASGIITVNTLSTLPNQEPCSSSFPPVSSTQRCNFDGYGSNPATGFLSFHSTVLAEYECTGTLYVAPVEPAPVPSCSAELLLGGDLPTSSTWSSDRYNYGTGVDAQTSESYTASSNPLQFAFGYAWTSACIVAQSCPAEGVASQTVTTTFELGGTVSEFDQTAFVNMFVAGANSKAGGESLLLADDVSVVVSAGSVVVVMTINAGSPTVLVVANGFITALANTSLASALLGVNVLSVSGPTVVNVPTTGVTPAVVPASNGDDNTALFIGIGAGVGGALVIVILVVVIVKLMASSSATPKMNTYPSSSDNAKMYSHGQEMGAANFGKQAVVNTPVGLSGSV